MRTFFALAWRNLWRNLSRSLIMIAGIAVGLFGLIVYFGISNGFIYEMVDVAIELELAHIQVNKQGYLKNPIPKNSFTADSLFSESLEQIDGVVAASGRFRAAVLISSAEKSSRVELVGVDPAGEGLVTVIPSLIVQGEYIQPGDNRKIVLGGELAKSLGVEIGDKVVVMAQDKDNELQSFLLRVGGVFTSSAPSWDKTAAFVSLEAMHQMINRSGEYTSILITVNNEENVDLIAENIRQSLAAKIAGLSAALCFIGPFIWLTPAMACRIFSPDLQVSTWLEISPLLSQSIDMFNSFVWIFYLIIYLAMAFGVINIMLMAVLDRTHELGVMRAVGTTPAQVMLVVLLEAAMLGMVGVAVGGSAAWLLNSYLSTHGLDLSYWSSGMALMGIPNVIHSEIKTGEWVISFISAEAAVIVASVWPAWRASRLKVVEAIHFE
jgi:ABC-type lipoprotein release transport system permease subunit